MNNWKQWSPYALAALCVVWILTSFVAPPEKDMDSNAFGRIPVVDDGRVQPFDSVARNALVLIRGGRQSANYEPWKSAFASPKIATPVEWALELMFSPELGDTRPIFRIDHPDLKSLFALSPGPNPELKTDGKYFSWNDLQPHFTDFIVERDRVAAIKAELRSAYERKVMELWNATNVYRKVKYALGPAAKPELSDGLVEYIQKLKKAQTAFQAQMDGETFSQAELDWGNDQFQTPLVVPPHHPELEKEDKWQRAIENVVEMQQQNQPPHFALSSFSQMAAAYKAGDAPGFRRIAEEYLNLLDGSESWKIAVGKAATEQRFNHIEPFYKGMYLSVGAFLLALLYWIAPVQLGWVRRAAVWLMVVVFVLHLGGQLFRMLHESRPPVTNLYSSAIFIGLMGVAFCLALEGIFPHGIGVLVASVVDFSALLIAHILSLREGDTMVMLQAVLDTNFWLATHVVMVTLGYTATFVAGFLGLLYVILGAFTNRLAQPIGKKSAVVGGAMVAGAAGAALAAANHEPGKPLGKILASMIYAIVCFGVLFSFVGTVLGGIWADQSWGRFWGWDVKENGALMIVLWNAIILHARWGGIAKERGVACLAVMGNVVTAWSWFGVNGLGIGLHSYGFTSGVAIVLWSFVGTQIFFAILGHFACTPECTPRGQKPVTLDKPGAPANLPPPLPA